jgi:hypothetical protein
MNGPDFIETNISKLNLKQLGIAINTYRIKLLFNIWKKHLESKNIEFEIFLTDILHIPSTITHYSKPPRKNNIEPKNQCMANIWKNATHIQCKRSKQNDSDYCKIHKLRQFYGTIND